MTESFVDLGEALNSWNDKMMRMEIRKKQASQIVDRKTRDRSVLNDYEPVRRSKDPINFKIGKRTRA